MTVEYFLWSGRGEIEDLEDENVTTLRQAMYALQSRSNGDGTLCERNHALSSTPRLIGIQAGIGYQRKVIYLREVPALFQLGDTVKTEHGVCGFIYQVGKHGDS